MSRPFWASGVTTMKMISSTSITSMSGVMLMSDIAPDFGVGVLVPGEAPLALHLLVVQLLGSGWLSHGSYPCTLRSEMSAISSTPASRQRSITFITSA